MLYESLIYKIAQASIIYLGRSWNASVAARFFRKCGALLAMLFSDSAIVDFVKREGVISRAFPDSAAYRLVDGLLSLPQRVLHPLYKRMEAIFSESIMFKVLFFVFERLHLLAAGFLFIALVVPHEKWNNLYSTLAMATLLILYLLKTVRDGRTGFYPRILDVFLVLFMVCVTLSEVFSIIPGFSLRFLIFYFTCFILVLLLMVTIRTKEDMSEVLIFLFVGLSIAGLYGVYQKHVGVPVNPAWIDTSLEQGDMNRVFSFFYNPNNFAEIIVMLLPFYLAAVFNTRSVLKKLIYLALAVPPLASLLFTLTRSAWIAFAVAGLVFVFFKEKRLIPVFLVLGVIAVPFMPQSIVMRMMTIVNPKESSIGTRMDLYQTVLPILKDYWFTGLGLGNDTLLRVARNYYSFLKYGAMVAHSHNLYLQVWLETGFAGILSLFAFFGATVKKSIRAICDFKDSYVSNILIAGLSSLSAMLVMGLVEYVWFYPRVMLIFWAVIGIMLAALCLNARSQENEKTIEQDAPEQDAPEQDAPEQDAPEQDVVV